MCHLILVLPVLGLAVFWLWPLSVAAPVYAVILAISLAMYYLIMQAVRRPVMTGAEEILQKTGKVLEVRGRKISVRVRGEIWNAESSDRLHTGDDVSITGLEGLVLRVQRLDDATTHTDTTPAVSK